MKCKVSPMIIIAFAASLSSSDKETTDKKKIATNR